MDVTDKIPADLTDQIFDGAWTTVLYDGKKFGMPWILDTKYLFYNTEMRKLHRGLRVLGRMVGQAKVIKDKGIVEHPSWGAGRNRRR